MHSLIKLAKFKIFRFSLKKLKIKGHVAQLDRASDSGSESRGFESLHARTLFYSLYPITLIPFGSSINPLCSKL